MNGIIRRRNRQSGILDGNIAVCLDTLPGGTAVLGLGSTLAGSRRYTEFTALQCHIAGKGLAVIAGFHRNTVITGSYRHIRISVVEEGGIVIIGNLYAVMAGGQCNRAAADTDGIARLYADFIRLQIQRGIGDFQVILGNNAMQRGSNIQRTAAVDGHIILSINSAVLFGGGIGILIGQ